MKKLSDYRIREENGKFIVQVKEATVRKRFLLKNLVYENWISASLFYSKLSEDGELVACKDVFDTLEAAKAQIIKWCEEPKYHYVVPVMREMPSWAKQEFTTQSVPCFSNESSKACDDLLKNKQKYAIKKAQEIAESAINVINDFYKTEQQMKEEITEKECVDAIKKQVDGKFSIPLTFEAKNMELQLENARLKGIIETLTAKKK